MTYASPAERHDLISGRLALPLRTHPAYLAAVLLAAGWWLHATHPHWSAYLLGIAAAAAWALGVFGTKWASLPWPSGCTRRR